jgi:hypothetical protein
MHVAVGVIGLLVLASIGILLIGGIAAVVALLANPKTRAAGAVLLAIGVVVVGGGVLLLLGLSITLPAVQRARSLAEQARLRDFKTDDQATKEFNRGFDEKPEPTPGTAKEQSSAPAAEPKTAAPNAEAKPKDTTGGEKPAPKASSSGESAPKKAGPPSVEARPAWVDKLPEGTADVYLMAIKTDPRPTRGECESELPNWLNKAICQYAETQLGRGPQVAEQLQLPWKYVEDHIVQQKWPEPVQISLGKWVQLHILLQFDQEAKRQIQKECDRVQRQLEEQWQHASLLRRLWYAGAGLAAVLVLLSMVYAGLKIDLATEGSCRGRLCAAAGAAILLMAGAAYLAVQSVHHYPVDAETVTPAALQADPSAYSVPEPSSPQAFTTALRYKFTVVPLGVLLLGATAVALTASKKTRPVGLVLLTLTFLGGLAAALSWTLYRAGVAIAIGPIELLVVGVGTVYILLLTVLSRGWWAWVLGLIPCFVAAVLLTPPDPLSMLLVGVPLCVLYTVAVFAWRARRKSQRVEGPPRERAEVEVGQP